MVRRPVRQGVQSLGEQGIQLRIRRGRRSRRDPHEVVPCGHSTGPAIPLDEDGPESTTDPVANHRRADRPGDRIGDPRTGIRPGSGRTMDQTERTPSDRPPLPTQASEVVTESESANQADRRARPFCRRAAMMARPARVCIRLRKPCLRARFLVFGWYVRFIEALLSATLASLGEGAPGVPSISWVHADPFAPDRSRRCSSATVVCDGGADVAVDPGLLPSAPWFERR